MAGLLAFAVLRMAAVRLSPATGAQMWPGHPNVVLNRTMARIGTLSARGQTLPPALMAQVDDIARKMPLAAEPFLIKGAVAQTDGRESVADRLYFAARDHDPRSRAARYFLAERYLGTGRPEPALKEMAVLARLTNATGVFAPALATYARSPGAVPSLRRFFRSSPEFEPAVLSHLAADARNLDLILALWSGRGARPGEAPPEWVTRILDALLAKGDYRNAYSIWRRYSGVGQGPSGLFNPEFRTVAAPPPFNWRYGSSGGIAEPAADGRLEVVYYGREDGVFAEQVLMLAPGAYQLSMNLSGDLKDAAGVAWSLNCLPQNQPVMRLPIQQSRSSAGVRGAFSVPAGCPAQRLQLAAEAGEFPNTLEFTVSNLHLAKVSRP